MIIDDSFVAVREWQTVNSVLFDVAVNCIFDKTCVFGRNCCLKYLNVSWSDAFRMELTVKPSTSECRPSIIGTTNLGTPFIKPLLFITGCFHSGESCRGKGADLYDQSINWYHWKTQQLFINKYCAQCNGFNVTNYSADNYYDLIPMETTFYDCNSSILTMIYNTTRVIVEQNIMKIQLCQMVLSQTILTASLYSHEERSPFLNSLAPLSSTLYSNLPRCEWTNQPALNSWNDSVNDDLSLLYWICVNSERKNRAFIIKMLTVIKSTSELNKCLNLANTNLRIFCVSYIPPLSMMLDFTQRSVTPIIKFTNCSANETLLTNSQLSVCLLTICKPNEWFDSDLQSCVLPEQVTEITVYFTYLEAFSLSLTCRGVFTMLTSSQLEMASGADINECDKLLIKSSGQFSRPGQWYLRADMISPKNTSVKFKILFNLSSSDLEILTNIWNLNYNLFLFDYVKITTGLMFPKNISTTYKHLHLANISHSQWLFKVLYLNERFVKNLTKVSGITNSSLEFCCHPLVIDNDCVGNVYSTLPDSSSYCKDDEDCILQNMKSSFSNHELIKVGSTNNGMQFLVLLCQSDPQISNHMIGLSTLVCLPLSILGLLVTLLTYILSDKLRNIPGWCIIFICFHLMILLILFLTSSILTQYDLSKWICQLIAVLSHFTLLCTFAWSAAFSCLMFQTLLFETHRAAEQRTNGNLRTLLLTIYIPIVGFIGISLICWKIQISFLQQWQVDYGMSLNGVHRFCWLTTRNSILIGVFIPAASLLFITLALLCGTLVSIFWSKRQTSHVSSTKSQRSTESLLIVLSLKLSSLLGIAWILPMINVAFNLQWLDFMNNLLVSLQGVIIFLSFVLANGMARRQFIGFIQKRYIIAKQSFINMIS